jgi:hypothetical protein
LVEWEIVRIRVLDINPLTPFEKGSHIQSTSKADLKSHPHLQFGNPTSIYQNLIFKKYTSFPTIDP